MLKHDYTGTPVLHPTPNRVRGGVFRWRGKTYRQTKGGASILEHGLAHGEPWQYGEPVVEADATSLETWLEFRLTERGVTVTYTIRNERTAEIPFGFGLHPYFQKLSGEDGTFVTLPADSVMDATSDLLPTGRILEVGGTIYDMRRPVAVGELDLDHAFTGLRSGEHARIEYRSLGMAVTLEATADFSHLVLYSPRGEVFFCLENQTCSTDAHNLFDRGFTRESGLKTVKPGETQRGSVTYSVSF